MSWSPRPGVVDQVRVRLVLAPTRNLHWVPSQRSLVNPGLGRHWPWGKEPVSSQAQSSCMTGKRPGGKAVMLGSFLLQLQCHLQFKNCLQGQSPMDMLNIREGSLHSP